jgi:rare lipoprotein A
MANGRIFNMHDYTVAHRRLPLGTRVCISNPQNGKWVFATVTDRGPYIHGRVVDLSKRVAQDLDIMDSGVAPVKIYVVSI